MPPVPSGPTRLLRPARIRLLALLSIRDDIDYLPAYIENVGAQVDGIVALDDGSTDGSPEHLESSPAVLEVLRVAPDRPVWDEAGNHRRLVAAALEHRPDWLVVVDADERLEREFRVRAERVIARGRVLGFTSYQVRLRELWNSPQAYRVDGIWGRKTRPRLFKARPDPVFDPRPLHAVKAPLQSTSLGRFPVADLEVFHLRMVRADDRRRRRQRYEQADPAARWQPDVGYAYLTDERGLRLRRVPADRAWAPVEAPAPAAEAALRPTDRAARL